MKAQNRHATRRIIALSNVRAIKQTRVEIEGGQPLRRDAEFHVGVGRLVTKLFLGQQIAHGTQFEIEIFGLKAEVSGDLRNLLLELHQR